MQSTKSSNGNLTIPALGLQGLILSNLTAMISAERSLASIAVGFLLLYIIGTLSWGIYNVYFHPLSRFPGPRIWAAYQFPFVFNTLRGRLPFKVLEFHRKYGPIVRTAPDELSFTDARAWNDIYGLQEGRAQNPKDQYTPQMPGYERNIIYAPDDDAHGRLRRIYGPAFTLKAVKEQNGLLTRYANLLITQLKIAIGKNSVQDMSAWFNLATFDILSDFAFGEDLRGLADGGKYHILVKFTFAGIVTGTQIQQLERYGLWSIFKSFLPKSFMKPKEVMDHYVKELVDRRLKQGYIPGKNDVFNYLLANKEDQLTLPELYENGWTLVAAGSETTASVSSGVIFLLCSHRKVLKKVQEEIRTVFQKDDDITPQSVNDLPYMLAVLSEAIRLHPATPFGLPRRIGAKNGQMVAGVWVPAKTRCSVPHFAAYRYEANFAKSDEFIPERWLSDQPAEFKNDKFDVVQPFHVGPRACLGKTLAHAELRLLLAKLLWNFDLDLENPKEDWQGNLKAYLIWERNPLMVRLTPFKH